MSAGQWYRGTPPTSSGAQPCGTRQAVTAPGRSGFLQRKYLLVFGFLANLFERGYTALDYAYSPELFGTRSRSLGTSSFYGLGRLSDAAGAWLLGALALAAFGTRTRSARLAEAERQRVSVLARPPTGQRTLPRAFNATDGSSGAGSGSPS